VYSTDVILDNDRFELFKARIKGTDKGEPIIANGAGAVNWQSTQIEMDKAALDKVNQVSLDHLLAVTATSKTSLGIEQSGVTRDTSKVMRDQLTSDAGIPLLTFIIEALNQDYKRYYPAEYRKNQYRLYIDSPLKTDREAEEKDIKNRGLSLDLYQSLVNRGYDRAIASKFAAGEITLEELGEPTKPPVEAPVAPVTPPAPAADEAKKPAEPKNTRPVNNQLAASDVSQLSSQEASLQNTISQVEEQLALAVINEVDKNVYDETSEVIAERDRKEQERQLTTALLVFYSLVVRCRPSSLCNGARSSTASRARSRRRSGATGHRRSINQGRRFTCGNDPGRPSSNGEADHDRGGRHQPNRRRCGEEVPGRDG
jgi:hypothetical protein